MVPGNTNNNRDVVRLLDVASFAEAVGMSVVWVRRRIAERALACVRIGRAVRIPVSEIERVITEGLIPAREAR